MTADVTRLFVAIDLDAAVASDVEEVRRLLTASDPWLGQRALRFVEPAQVHLTVRFIGEVADEVATAVAGVLDTAVPVPPFTLTLAAPGWLPGPSRPRVLTYDVVSGQDEVRRVHAFVEAALGGAGIAGEARPFVPHVTLARVRDEWARRVRAEAATIERRLRDRAPLASVVTGLTLFESRLTPRGAVHTPRVRAPLDPGDGR